MTAVPAVAPVVVDTCVVSFIFKRDTRLHLYAPHLEGKLLVISPMTVAELERWSLSRNWGAARRYEMQQHLQQYVVQPFSLDLCVKWAEVTENAHKQGFTVTCADAWVAAVAVLHRIPLVTNSGNDFRGIDGLTVITA